jgi:hypothetical protein
VNGELDDDPLTDAERRLIDHVAALRRTQPEASDALVAAVVGKARWQAVVRPYLTAAGGLTAALALGLQLLAGGQRRT